MTAKNKQKRSTTNPLGGPKQTVRRISPQGTSGWKDSHYPAYGEMKLPSTSRKRVSGK